MKYTLHPFETEHRQPIIDIYNYYIRNTFATYSTQEVGLNHFAGHTGYSVRYKMDKVVGFVIIRPFLTVHDICYYIDKKHTGRGIGFLILSKVDIKPLSVHICSLNKKSIKFHLKYGFTEYGRLKDAGKKFDKIYDIVFMRK